MLVLKRIGFYFLSFTWGALTSLMGLFMIIVLGLCRRIHIFHGRLYGVIGTNGGGVSLGCFFLCGEKCQYEQLMAHECGHGLQNIIGGPLMIFVILIPSAIRYGYRELKYERKGRQPATGYDDIWFEGQATRWGQKYIDTDRI